MTRNISLSVPTALRLGIAVISVVTLLVTGMFLRQDALLRHTHSAVLHSHEIAEALQSLDGKIKDAFIYQRNYLIAGAPVLLDSYRILTKPQQEQAGTASPAAAVPPYRRPIAEDLRRLDDLTTGDAPQRDRLDRLSGKIRDLIGFLDEMIRLRQTDRDKTLTPENTLRGKAILDSIRALTAQMQDEETRRLYQQTQRDEAMAHLNTILVLSAIGFFYATKLVLSWLVMRQWRQTQRMEILQQARADDVAAANQKLKTAYMTLERMNAQIKESGQAHLRAVVDHALDGLITIDARGIVESFNPACEKIFGYRADDVIGQNIKMLMPEPYHAEHDGYIRNYHDTGKAAIIGTAGREVSARRKDGSVFPIDLAISTFWIDGAQHFSGILRDITQRKEAEAAVLRYTRELEHSNQELDDFAYIASHDLKEPLRGLFNHASFLLEDYRDKLDEEGVRRLGRLSQLAQRMERLVNDLLYFSRLGRADLAIQPTNPNDVIRDVEQMMDSFLKERGATIVIPTLMPSLVCDKPRITEVFRNLITNAVKYNDKPEKTVEIGFLAAAAAPHGPEKNVFYVKDNGIGIAPEFHQEIFRIFKRLNKSEDKEAGTGVGLTFVKKIVERHKGTIWLQSQPGQGTIFYFNLNQEST